MKKARGQSYDFVLHAPVKLNVTQELSQKEAAIMYSKSLYSDKRVWWILTQTKAALGGFAHSCHLFCGVESPKGSSLHVSHTASIQQLCNAERDSLCELCVLLWASLWMLSSVGLMVRCKKA